MEKFCESVYNDILKKNNYGKNMGLYFNGKIVREYKLNKFLVLVHPDLSEDFMKEIELENYEPGKNPIFQDRGKLYIKIKTWKPLKPGSKYMFVGAFFKHYNKNKVRPKFEVKVAKSFNIKWN